MELGTIIKVEVKSTKFEESFSKELIYNKANVVYIDRDGENDNNDGATEKTSVATLQKAYSLLPENIGAKYNIIVVMKDYANSLKVSVKKEESDVFVKPATITGKYMEKDYSSSISLYYQTYFNANTIIKDIKITGSSSMFIYAQENDLTLEDTVTFDSTMDMDESIANLWGIKDINNYNQLKKITIIGGTLNYNKNTHDEIKRKESNITIRCTGVAVVTGGSRTQEDGGSSEVYGSLDKHANVKINIDIPNSNNDLDIGTVVGGQTDGSAYLNSQINVENGKIGRILGGTLGYGNYYAKIPSDTFYGSSNININGGTVNEIFGGSLGRNKATSYMYGQVKLNINGGTIKNNVYGGSEGITDYTETAKVIGNIVLNIEGENVKILGGNVFGGGNSGIVNGNINVTLKKTILNGNIFGGGNSGIV